MNRCIVLLLLISALGVPVHGEAIQGKACYRFSDNESINVARDIALSLAKRDALESYVVFVESTSVVENATLKNDLISSITGGLLRNVRITTNSEDLGRREVCRSIIAEVDPLEIKQQAIAKVNAFRRERANLPTGLPESVTYKVVKLDRIQADRDYSRPDGECSKDQECVVVVGVCKTRVTLVLLDFTWYDQDGIPDTQFKGAADCSKAGDVKRHYFALPPANFTFRINLDVLKFDPIPSRRR